MSKRVGVVGISLNKLKGNFGSKALELSGNNFGNMLFTNAVYKQIPSCKHIGFSLDVDKVKNEIDHIIIPAANWVNPKEDWGFLADALEKIDLPVCVVGLGSQLDNLDQAEQIPEGTQRFIKVVSDRCSSIGVRGHFTESVLHKLGIKNVTPLGCPSIFFNRKVPELRTNFPTEDIRIGVGPTRYGLPKPSQLRSADKQRQLYKFALEHGSSIYFQSEAFEIAFLNREDITDKYNDAVAYYEVKSSGDLSSKLLTKGKYHKDLDQWLADAIKDDIYIGTRIHGAVAAILSGTPAVLITHDNRTRELANIMGIPSIDIEMFEISMLNDMNQFIGSFDFTGITKISQINIERFRNFYHANGLETSI